MRILYDFAILCYTCGIRIAAIFGNQKARKWLDGRRNQEEKIKDKLRLAPDNRIWFHCASLGEFEQGRPLLDKIKSNDPSTFIILTFYSPSGYEIRKNYPGADLVCYLPADSKKNAARFIELLRPSVTIFVKYELWLHFFEELLVRNRPVYVVSAVFRPGQFFFKWYGAFLKKILKQVNGIFVQDRQSFNLLEKHKFENVFQAGDTRFDRVRLIASQKQNLKRIETFAGDKKILVAGSTWPDDESMILNTLLSEKMHSFRLIIAPHEVHGERIHALIAKIHQKNANAKVVQYSSEENAGNADVLIMDTIGILSMVYSYGTIAWIGGGFGRGIHNILEAAAFGLPVLFGPNYQKFREAVDLIQLGGAFSISTPEEAAHLLKTLVEDENRLKESSIAASTYVNSQAGATEKILSEISLPFRQTVS